MLHVKTPEEVLELIQSEFSPVSSTELVSLSQAMGRILAEDIALFRARGLVCKLTGIGKEKDGKISACVEPILYSADAPEAAVPKNFNLITLVGSASDRMSFYGQGAGRYPTAYNVLQDCMDIQSGKGFYAPYGEKRAACNDEKRTYYVRGATDTYLEEITREKWGDAVITVPVEAAKIHAWRAEHPEVFIAAFEK